MTKERINTKMKATLKILQEKNTKFVKDERNYEDGQMNNHGDIQEN